MSRSNPSDWSSNPAVRWFEWNGEKGVVRYYDKDAKQSVEVGDQFTFVLLDQLGTVGGWHDPSQSGIYANEVKDTRTDILVVKSFKGGSIAEGLYKDIKDRVNAAGGSFVANCYIAFKDGDDYSIASLKFKGAALSAWMDFTKDNRADLYKQAIGIRGYEEGKKGRVIFRKPILKLVPLSEEGNEAAIALDEELQDFFEGYLKRAKGDQAESAAAPDRHMSDEEVAGIGASHYRGDQQDYPAPVTDDDIPF